jgi:serine protease Do
MPITSISFSLKSNVAKQWLRDQDVSFRQIPPSERPAVDKAATRTTPLPVEPTISPSSPLAASSRPYNLDRLISERSRAEADLEEMIKEMRGRFSGR